MRQRLMLYGLWRDETFVVLDAEWAYEADRELARLAAITTWEQALDAIRSMTVISPPLNPEDPDFDPEEWGFAPGRAMTAQELPGVADGDYPPMPGTLTEDWLPEDLLRGSEELNVDRVTTVLNGDYVLIDPSQEAELVRALERRGFVTVRDDDLIERISWSDL